MQEFQPEREQSAGQNRQYTYSDGFRLRLHIGETERHIRLFGPDGADLGRLMSVTNRSPAWNDRALDDARVEVYEMARQLRPQDGYDVSAIQQTVSADRERRGLPSAMTTGMTPRGAPPGTPGLPPMRAPGTPTPRPPQPGAVSYRPVGRR